MKQLIIMAGLPASGKSTFASEYFNHLPIVDCDLYKRQLPGYDPAHPETVHAQSKAMEKEAIYRYLAAGESFLYDTTATDSDKAVALITEARTLGYTVTVHYMHVSLATALTRNAARERKVPEAIILDKYERITQSMDVIRRFADFFLTHNNDN